MPNASGEEVDFVALAIFSNGGHLGPPSDPILQF